MQPGKRCTRPRSSQYSYHPSPCPPRSCWRRATSTRHCCTAPSRSPPSPPARYVQVHANRLARIMTLWQSQSRARPQLPRPVLLLAARKPLPAALASQGASAAANARGAGRRRAPLPLDDPAPRPRGDGRVTVGRRQVGRSAGGRKSARACNAGRQSCPDACRSLGCAIGSPRSQALMIKVHARAATLAKQPTPHCMFRPQGVRRLLRGGWALVAPAARACGGGAGAHRGGRARRRRLGDRQHVPHASGIR